MATTWRRLMMEVDDLVEQSNAALFERVRRLVLIEEDKEFIAHHQGDYDKAVKDLDSRLGDYGVEYHEAKAMFKRFPKKRQWENGNVRQLLSETLAALEEERKQRRVPRTVTRVTIKEHEQVVKQRDKAEADVARLNDEAQATKSLLDRLEQENRRLTLELAKAEGRISELERQLKLGRETVSA